MYKIFNPPTERLTGIEMGKKYGDLGYIMIDPEDVIVNDVIYPSKGTLIGIADQEDYMKMLDEVYKIFGKRGYLVSPPVIMDFDLSDLED